MELKTDIECVLEYYLLLIIVSTGMHLWLTGDDYALGMSALASEAYYWCRHEASMELLDDFTQQTIHEIDSLLVGTQKELKRTVASVQQATGVTVHPPRYHRTDLAQLFNVRYLPDNVNSAYVEKVLKKHGAEDAWLAQPWLNNGARLMLNGSAEIMDALIAFNADPLLMERRFHVQWSDPGMGYGTFASKHIEADEVLDIYSGVVTHKNPNMDYEWTHPRLKVTDEICGIDARIGGNSMRFVNDNPGQRNLIPMQAQHGDLFYLVYASGKKPIQKGKQLFVSYGSSYWNTRKSKK